MDAASSAALCLTFVAATALLFRDSNSRGCVMSAARRGGVSAEGAASKEAQMSFSLDDRIHQWPAGKNDTRTEAHVGWTMLVEVLFAGQLYSEGHDPNFQRQLAAHVKRVWGPFTVPGRALRKAGGGAGGAPASRDDAVMAAIYDAGMVSLFPRSSGADAGSAAAFDASSEDLRTRLKLDGYVTMHPRAEDPLVGPAFVGYDMIETSLRAYAAGEAPGFVSKVAPYVKGLWEPHTKALEKEYGELSDYDKVMVDAYRAGAVDLDVFRPRQEDDALRAEYINGAARIAAQVCALFETAIAACLLCAAAFGGSAVLAGLDIKAMRGAVPPITDLDGPFKGMGTGQPGETVRVVNVGGMQRVVSFNNLQLQHAASMGLPRVSSLSTLSSMHRVASTNSLHAPLRPMPLG